MQKILIVIFCGLVAVPTIAAVPVVSNVVMTARVDGTKFVDVFYDVADDDGDLLAVTLQLSDNSGVSWDFPVLSATGDIGSGVSVGTGKQIIWDAGFSTETLVSDSFRARVIASDVGVEYQVHSPRHVAITDFGWVDWSDQAIIERYSRADLLLVMGHHLWMGGSAADIDVITQLKAINPDITILGYVSAKSAHLSGPTQDPSSYWYKWYYRTEPYFMLTTAGEMAQDWPNSRLINILDPECRRVQIETIVEMQGESLNKFDGVYWDYFNNSIWVPPSMNIQGDVDLDGDSIPHDLDPDERQAYQDAQVSLVHALRDSVGVDFIQFFNGTRAYRDMEFAALADGAMYELFPTLSFPDPDMDHALDPNYEFSLFNVRPYFRTQNGGPFLVFANPWINRYADHNYVITDVILGDVFRAVALIMDGYSSWNVGSFSYGWSLQDISLGDPLGTPVFDGAFIRREFEYGNVEIEMTSGMYPNPFDYRIHLLGSLVEELAIPFHYP